MSTAHAVNPSIIDPLSCFCLRAEARAILVREWAITLHEAVDGLQQAAEEADLISQIGQDAIQAIMAEAFRHA